MYIHLHSFTKWILLFLICGFGLPSDAQHNMCRKDITQVFCGGKSPEQCLKTEIEKAAYVFEASCIESYWDTTADNQPVIVAKFQLHKVFKGELEPGIIEIIYDGRERTYMEGHVEKKRSPKLLPVGVGSMFMFSENSDLPNRSILSINTEHSNDIPENLILMSYIWELFPEDKTSAWSSYPDAVYYSLYGRGHSFHTIDELYDFILSVEGTAKCSYTDKVFERPASIWEWKTQKAAKQQKSEKKSPNKSSIKH